MKKVLLSFCIAAAFGAQAQTTVDSTSGSASNAGAQSGSSSALNANNSGNASANGNVNASGSDSRSNSGASSGSQSGAMGNNLTMNNYAPEVQHVISDMRGTSSSNNTSNNTSKETSEVHYSGGTHNYNEQGGEVTNRIVYSGTQTIKNVPGIAMSGPASGPCTGASGGLGLAGPGWGLGLNGSTVMADCRLRENTRVLGMAMQSLDGAANPQEKAEVTVMFMDAVRALGAYNAKIAGEELGEEVMKSAVKLALGMAAWAALGLAWVGTSHAQGFVDEPVCYSWAGGDKSAGSFVRCTPPLLAAAKPPAPPAVAPAPAPVMMPMASCPPVKEPAAKKIVKRKPAVKC